MKGNLPHLHTNLSAIEQGDILLKVNGSICRCAFDFFTYYRFPIRAQPGQRLVEAPTDLGIRPLIL